MKRSLWYTYKVKVMSELQRRRDLSNRDLTVATQRVDQIKKLPGKYGSYPQMVKSVYFIILFLATREIKILQANTDLLD